MIALVAYAVLSLCVVMCAGIVWASRGPRDSKVQP